MVRTTLASLFIGVLTLGGAAMAWGQSTDERPTIGGTLADRLGLRPLIDKVQTPSNSSGNSADSRFQSRPSKPSQYRPTERLTSQQDLLAPRTGSPSVFRSRSNPTPEQSEPRVAQSAPREAQRAPAQAPTRSSRRRGGASDSDTTGLTDSMPRGIDALRDLPNSNTPDSTEQVASHDTEEPEPVSSNKPSAIASESHVSDTPALADKRNSWKSSSIQDRLSNAREMNLEAEEAGTGPAEVPPATTRAVTIEPKPDSAMEEHDNIVSPQTPAPRIADRRSNTNASSTSTSARNVLITRKSPVLSVETIGPSRVLIGREAKYTVVLSNAGTVNANGVQVSVSVPDGCDVVGFDPSFGQTRDPQVPEKRGIIWMLDQLPAGETAELDVKIVPRDSRPFDLGVQWTYSSQATQAMVEVQEPKLSMSLSGPDEVAYGQPATYKLTLSNPGTGLTEGVMVRLLPTMVGAEAMPSHRVGSLEPGESTSIELELTARESGQLAIKAEATADGGLQAAVNEEVLVRKPEVALELVGPRFLYAGTAATYTVRATNPGNAPAKNVTIEALIPSTGEFVSSTLGGEFDQASRKVTWTLASLPAGSHRDIEFKCILKDGGVIKQQVSATGDDDVRDQQLVTTQVEALADLVLDVIDPKGPVPLSEETVYEVRVRNRGTDSARGVEIVTFFSEGLEAVAVEGGRHEIAPGQVLIHPIESLGPGREIVYKMKLRADTTGNHVFRAEVRCESLDSRLAVEETTRFYGQPATAAVNQPNQPARLMEQPTEAAPQVTEPPAEGSFE